MCSKQPYFSIIVPVYNSEKYLEKCLGSIQDQSFTDFEVIVVDDGSTDSSGMIGDVFQDKDDRFVVIHNSNQGVSAARNVGLENANGLYVLFVDSDDWIDKKTLSIIRKICNEYNDPDIVAFNYYEYTELSDEEHKRSYFNFSECRIYKHDNAIEREGIDYLQNSILAPRLAPMDNSLYSMGVPWGKAYSRALLSGSGVRFDESLVLNEDVVFNIKLFQICKCIVYICDALYHYRIYGSSSMGKLNMDYTKSVSERLKLIYEYESMRNEYKNLDAAFEEKKYRLLIECLYYLKKTDKNNESIILKKNVYKLVLATFKNNYFSIKDKLRLIKHLIK